MIAAFRDPDRTQARAARTAVIYCLRGGVPTALTELLRLSRTLTQRASDVLAYFDRARHLQRTHRSTQRPA